MAQYEHLPIYKAAFDLLIYFEKIVSGFSRYHKYTHGKVLRDTAREVLMLIVRANNTEDKLPVLEEIRISLEELKVGAASPRKCAPSRTSTHLRHASTRSYP